MCRDLFPLEILLSRELCWPWICSAARASALRFFLGDAATGLFWFRLRFLTNRVSSSRFIPVAPTSDRAWIYSAHVFFSLPRNQGFHRGSLFFIRAALFGLNRGARRLWFFACSVRSSAQVSLITFFGSAASRWFTSAELLPLSEWCASGPPQAQQPSAIYFSKASIFPSVIPIFAHVLCESLQGDVGIMLESLDQKTRGFMVQIVLPWLFPECVHQVFDEMSVRI
jgi:hypothetical protein